jgi:hypothetical protein
VAVVVQPKPGRAAVAGQRWRAQAVERLRKLERQEPAVVVEQR